MTSLCAGVAISAERASHFTRHTECTYNINHTTRDSAAAAVAVIFVCVHTTTTSLTIRGTVNDDIYSIWFLYADVQRAAFE